MQVLYKDLAVDGVFTSFNLDTSTSIDNLVDHRLSRSSKFIYSSGITITLTFDTPKTIKGVAVGGSDLSDATQITVNGNTSTQQAKDGNVFTVLDEDLTASIFTIVLTDEGSFTGQNISIGRLMVGDVYQTPGINDNVTLDYIVDTNTSFSASRQVYGQPLVNYTSIFVQIPVVEQDERSALQSFQGSVMNYKPFFLNFDEDCFDEGPFYAILGGQNSFGYQFNGAHFWTIGLTFDEVF